MMETALVSVWAVLGDAILNIILNMGREHVEAAFSTSDKSAEIFINNKDLRCQTNKEAKFVMQAWCYAACCSTAHFWFPTACSSALRWRLRSFRLYL